MHEYSNVVSVKNVEELVVAFRELQNGQTVVLAAEQFVLTETIQVNKENVTITGNSAGTSTLLCPNVGSILDISAKNVSVAKLAFEGCRDVPAVSVCLAADKDQKAHSVVFEDVSFRNNSNKKTFSSAGGALSMDCGNSLDCKISPPSVAIKDSMFKKNEASIGGGGIYNIGCSVEISNSIFERNTARTSGGAVQVAGECSTLKISRTAFKSNTVYVLPKWSSCIRTAAQFPIEPEKYFTFQCPPAGGGAIFASTVAQVILTECSFIRNAAPSGGALWMEVDARSVSPDGDYEFQIDLANCTFEGNEAKSSSSKTQSEKEMYLGGAVYLASSSEDLKVFTFINSTFRNNTAEHGGAVHIVALRGNTCEMKGCVFVENTAKNAGGALLLRNIGRFEVRSTELRKNYAELGGAVLATNNAKLTVKKFYSSKKDAGLQENSTVLKENNAVHGGGIMCAGCGELELEDVHFVKNSVTGIGGGLYVLDSAHEAHIEQSFFDGNLAVTGGGAAFRADGTIKIIVTDKDRENLFQNNMAVFGAGLFIEANRRTQNSITVNHCRFYKNRAVYDASSTSPLSDEKPPRPPANAYSRTLLLQEVKLKNAKELSEPAPVNRVRGCGGGFYLLLNNVPEEAVTAVKVSQVSLEENKAVIGGGAFVDVAGNRWNEDSQLFGCKEASPTTHPCRTFRFIDVNFTNNEAKCGAGGLFVSSPEAALVGCKESAETEWQTIAGVWENKSFGPSTCFRFNGNFVKDFNGTYGPDLASGAYGLLVVDPTTPILNHKGGDRLLPPCANGKDCFTNRTNGIMIDIRDAFNQTITGGIPDAELPVLVLSSDTIGEQAYIAKHGRVNVNNTVGVGVDKKSTIQFRHTRSRLRLETNLNFTTRDCIPGEHKTSSGCIKCEENQYSFNTTSRCIDCEPQAVCPGQSALVPKDGFWHSTPFSPQFHECIIKDACVYENRSADLSKYYSITERVGNELKELNNAVPVNRKDTSSVYEDYKQCAPGYKGVLCGSCAPGYGYSAERECDKCPSNRAASISIYALTALLCFVAMGIQMLATLSSSTEQVSISIAKMNVPGADRIPISLQEVFGGGAEGRHSSLDFISEEDSVYWVDTVQSAPSRPQDEPRDRLITDHVFAEEKLSEVTKVKKLG